MIRKKFLIPWILLSVVATFFLVIIFISKNPDRLKPLITAQFAKYTKGEINIDDRLSFSFFPYFGVKAKHIQITIPKQSQTPITKIDLRNVVVQLKLFSFLHSEIKTGIIQIDELTLQQRTPLLTIKLNDVSLKAIPAEESDHTYMTMVSFNFASDSVPLSGKVVIAGNVMLDMTHQTATWENIHAVVHGLTMQGELNAKNILDNPEVSGHFVLQSENLKNTINLFTIETENIPAINGVTADINFSANNQSLIIQSNLNITNIKISETNIDAINARLNFRNNLVNIESIHANAFGGDIRGEANINFNTYRPTMTARVKCLNVQIEPLFKLIQTTHANINPDTRLSGTGNIELDISTSGTDGKNLLNNLNGTTRLSVSNGIFMGKDWDELVIKVAALNPIITNEVISPYLRIFRFKQLFASFKINNGNFSGDDLLVESSDIIIKGKGQINLQNNFINYVLQAELQNPKAYNDIDNDSTKVIGAIAIKGLLTTSS